MEPQSLLPCSQEPATGPILSQNNLVHTLTTYFSKIHSNICFPSMPRSSEQSSPFRFSDQNTVCMSNFSHACYMPHPSKPPSFDHPNNSSSCAASPASHHFLTSRSKILLSTLFLNTLSLCSSFKKSVQNFLIVTIKHLSS